MENKNSNLHKTIETDGDFSDKNYGLPEDNLSEAEKLFNKTGLDNMACVKDYPIKQKTSAQDVLIVKILKSKRILDSEYQDFKAILNRQVLTTYDAGIFIEYVLALLKFRRTFTSKKHKAYKKCIFCSGRDKVQRFLDLENDRAFWICESCAVNLDASKFVPVKISEKREADADLHRKYDYSAEQENLDEEIRYENKE